jgi:hypothetical protein
MIFLKKRHGSHVITLIFAPPSRAGYRAAPWVVALAGCVRLRAI